MKLTTRALRARAFEQTLGYEGSLRDALAQLEFVQADPIRSPARAQDLILRQRVGGYRIDDLERAYPELGVEEGFLYAYGFLSRRLWELRHPPDVSRLSAAQRRLLDAVRELGEAGPRELLDAFGKRRARNAWGGYSTSVKLSLEALHARGLLRVARRTNGIRIYAPRPLPEQPPSDEGVLAESLGAVVRLLAPISEQSLRAVLSPLARALGQGSKSAIESARRAGTLEWGSSEGVSYYWPSAVSSDIAEPPRRVRLLAPFDPLVWDRRRFEHLWGWVYRFEAYTPVARRVRGYYAMPLAWADRVIGWANVSRAGSGLDVDVGFAGSRPRERDFRNELDAEIERMRAFLEAEGST